MKLLKSSQFIAASLAILAATVIPASSQSTSVIVDEFGNGTINGTPFLGQPSPPFGLQYNLGYVVVPGTIIVRDNNPLETNQISDIILFTNTFLFFQSDSRDGADSPADVASFDIDTNTVMIQIQEQGVEGNNFAVYTPGVGMPGYSSLNPTYTFISDIPEPDCGLIAVAGFAAFCCRRWLGRRIPTFTTSMLES